MGEVIPLFNDRRHPKPDPTVSDPKTRLELFEHLRKMHHWGGPRSSTKDRMQNAHGNDHRFGGIQKPHTHD